MNIANFEYNELGSYYNQHITMTNTIFHENIGIYNSMFSDELFGYRNGRLELMLDILYFNDYLYAIIQQIKELKEDTVDNRKEILKSMNWECIVKTFLCSGIKIGKYYNKILSL